GAERLLTSHFSLLTALGRSQDLSPDHRLPEPLRAEAGGGRVVRGFLSDTIVEREVVHDAERPASGLGLGDPTGSDVFRLIVLIDRETLLPRDRDLPAH